MKKTVFLLTTLTLLSLSLFSLATTKINGFVFDPQAELKPGLSGSHMNGYILQVAPSQQFPFIYIKRGDGKNYTYAAYNWKFQYWVYSLGNFDRKKINPKNFYSKIELASNLLVRGAPSKELQDKLKRYSTGSSVYEPVSKGNQKTPADRSKGGIKYDPRAVPNTSIKSLNGYRIQFVQPVKIRDQVLFWARGVNKPVASYNWKKQHWNYINRNIFKPESVKLKSLFRKVALSAEELDRMSPMANYKTANQLKQENKANDQDTGWSDYDHNAKVNPRISSLGGYRVVVDKPLSNGQVFFYSTAPGKKNWILGNYNWKKQYWTWTLKQLNRSKIDLKKLYISVKRTSAQLDRLKPKDLSIWNYAHLEKKPYNYSSNLAFRAFMDYLDSGSAGYSIKQKYLGLANNPAKLGGYYRYTPREIPSVKIGYFPQYMIKKPGKFYKFYDPRVTSPTHIAGGISYYLELGMGRMITKTSPVQYIFKNNSIVPITLVEIQPMDGKRSESLSISAIAREMESLLESVYFKKFKISTKTIKVDYGEMETVKADDDRVMHRSKTFEKWVYKRFGYDKIYAFYFTDAAAFAKIDYHLSHPIIHGAYVANWRKKKMTFAHEFGHALGLYHHFGKRENAGKKGAHISEPCIMNYRKPYKTDKICHLCRFALEIPARKWKGK